MKLRLILVTTALVSGFVFFTSGPRWKDRLLDPVRGASKLWTGPDAVRTAGLSSDEVNNIDIYKAARTATVNITSTVNRRNWFFEATPARDVGSGFIINDDGRILTNSHVLQGSSRVEVTLQNHDIYEAVILARDPRNDLGLIKIVPKKKLPVLRLGDSDVVQVGQKVLAIGNPFGLEGTLTTGIVSSLGRDIQGERGVKLEGMLQTDAAINPGNSGGPLLDSQGNVIGINTAIYGPGGNIGIGFAMPINRAKTMLEEFAAGRSFRRPRLGITVIYIAGDLAEALDLPSQGGLLVQEIVEGSAAAAAGMRGPRQFIAVGNSELGVGGDLILAINGQAVDRSDSLTRVLNKKRPGDELDLAIFRGGRQIRLKVKLGEDLNEPN